MACNRMVSRAFVDVMAFIFVRTCSMTMAIDPITIMYLMYSDSDVMTICQDGTRPRLMAKSFTNTLPSMATLDGDIYTAI